MKTTIDKKALAHALDLAAGVAPRKSTMPILQNVLLTARGKTLTVEATDLTRGISVTVAADGTKGAIALPARDLLERVKAMPGDTVTIDGETLRGTGSRRYRLHSMNADEFPAIAWGNPADEWSVPASHLAGLVAAVAPAVSDDESRPQMASALLETGHGVVRMVATDGKRLASAEFAGGSGERSAMIQRSGLSDLARLCDAAETIVINADDTSVYFGAGDVRYQIKKPNAVFPPWRQVVPDKTLHAVTVNRAALVDVIRGVALAAPSGTGGVECGFAPGGLLVRTESPETGEASDSVSIDYDGPETTIGLNAAFMLDALAAVADETVTIGFGTELDPVLVRAAGYLGVVMPMRLR